MFLKSTDFSKAFVLTIAIATAIVAGIYIEFLDAGIALAMGALLSSPNDVTGSFRHTVMGIFLAAVLAALLSVITGYAALNVWVLIPVVGVLMFAVSYLAVFGFRASLIAFSGLFAVVLSLANISDVLEIWERGLFIMFGGFWYLLLSITWSYLNPNKPTEQLLAECLRLTSGYLRIRADLLTNISERKTLKKELILLQGELNEKHESLREILLSSRKTSGISNYSRKRLLIFIELVDILELAMANPVNYKKMDQLLKEEQEQILAMKSAVVAMAIHLEHIAEVLEKRLKLKDSDFQKHLEIVENNIENYRNQIDITKRRENLLLLRNLHDYQEKQAQKINRISRILKDLNPQKSFLKGEEAQRFLTSQDYDPKILVENFNLHSPVFKHALRLAVIVLLGLSIGLYFSIQNAYWILLTIVVIMRPNYGLTKERSKQRMLGTILGAVIAVGIVFLTQNKIIYAFLGLFSLTLAFSLVQKNYKTSAVFVTLSIVFIYSLLQPNVLEVIQYRVIDTFIGAALAALGNLFLWPSWEIQGIKRMILSSIKANGRYLKEIDEFYHQKEHLPISYKLARKEAFLEMGNLSNAFQRMTQEPKSRQKELSNIYKIVGLNQTFLSSLASLGTYIQSHKTTRASQDFEKLVGYVILNLQNAEILLENKKALQPEREEEMLQAQRGMQRNFEKLIGKRNMEIEAGQHNIGDEMRLKLQEAQLVTDQLQWLLEISEKIKITIAENKLYNL